PTGSARATASPCASTGRSRSTTPRRGPPATASCRSSKRRRGGDLVTGDLDRGDLVPGDVVVRQVTAGEDLAGPLADVLVDCVEGGASVGFMLPLGRDRAE